MAWDENTLLLFMQRNSRFFGSDIKGIEAAKTEWLCKRFTNKLIQLLDWTQVIDLPYVDVEYEGKGDVKSIKAKKDFCLTSKQCVTIANFIAGRMPQGNECFINNLDSFAIIQYIDKDTPIYKDWIRVLYRLVADSVTSVKSTTVM